MTCPELNALAASEPRGGGLSPDEQADLYRELQEQGHFEMADGEVTKWPN